MKLETRIAKILFDAGIRLDDEGSLNAIGICDKNDKLAAMVACEVMKTGDIELTVRTDEIEACGGQTLGGALGALCLAAYGHAKSRLALEIDEELWQMQLAEKGATKEDAAYEELKSRHL